MADRDALKCPECLLVGTRGRGRIGNRKTKCPTCNSFVRRVERATAKTIKDTMPDTYDRVYREEERRLYEELTRDLPTELFDPTKHRVDSRGSTPREGGDDL